MSGAVYVTHRLYLMQKNRLIKRSESMTFAPIVLFVYNRPVHTRQTLESLARNPLAAESELFIYADGPKEDATDQTVSRVKDVRSLIRERRWCKTVHIAESEKNKGLAESVIAGVTEIVNRFERIIVLEDDLLLADTFLSFMNMALETYKNDLRIFSVSGYRYPGIVPRHYQEDVFLFPRASSWGWGTWKGRWSLADWQLKDFDKFMSNKDSQKRFNAGGRDLTGMLVSQAQGKIDSWAIRWCYAQHVNNAYGLFPVKSRVQNIGFDGSGIHCGKTDKNYGCIEDFSDLVTLPQDIEIDSEMIKNHAAFFGESHRPPTAFQRLKKYLADMKK